MQVTGKIEGRDGKSAFTLIELMVVVAVVGILIGGVFQLLNAARKVNQKATTTAKLQRLQNALSGFYAEYGTYPPVGHYDSPDPWDPDLKDEFGDPIGDISTEDGFAKACNLTARSQSVAFSYPNVTKMDDEINTDWAEYGVWSGNSKMKHAAASATKDEWGEIKMFKFGLLSFLLPRVEQIGFTGVVNPDTQLEPDIGFFQSRQWQKNNPVSHEKDTRRALQAQQTIENRAAARWLPNLEKMVVNGKYIMGVNTHTPGAEETGGLKLKLIRDKDKNIIEVKGYLYNGEKYGLPFVTILDDYGREFCYYSPPPHQSYRIWSAGGDGKTFPPWIPLESLPEQERKWVTKWLEDDIVRFDR